MKFPNRLENKNRISLSKLTSYDNAIVSYKIEQTNLYFEPFKDTNKNISIRELNANRWVSCLDWRTFHDLASRLRDSKDSMYFVQHYESSKPNSRVIYKISPDIGESKDEVLGNILQILYRHKIKKINKLVLDVKLYISGNSFITFTTSHPDYRLTFYINDILQHDTLINGTTWLSALTRQIALLTKVCYDQPLSYIAVKKLLDSYDTMPNRQNVLIKLNRIDLAFFLNWELSEVCRDKVLQYNPIQEKNSLYLNKDNIIYYPKNVQLVEQKLFKKSQLLNIRDKLELRMNNDFIKKTLKMKFGDLNVKNIDDFIKKYNTKLDRKMKGLIRYMNLV